MLHLPTEDSRHAALLTGSALGLLVSAGGHAAPDDLQLFVAAHRCEAVERLGMIGAAPARGDRYVVVELSGTPRAYVQMPFSQQRPRAALRSLVGLLFTPLRRAAERSSGTRRTECALSARLWHDGSRGNYQRVLPMRSTLDRDAAADLMLSALHDGYGARLASRPKWHVPLADADRVAILCAPRG